MKKICKFIKSNFKVIIAFIIGIIVSGTGVYAATIIFNSDEVGFDNTNANLTLNNVPVDNVQDAIDAIYTKVTGIQTQLNTCTGDLSTAQTNYSTCSSSLSTAQSNYSTCSSSLSTCQSNLTTVQNNMVTYRDEICPGCVYRKSTTDKYNSNARSANGTNNKLSSSEYTTDYTTLNSNSFLGHVIDGSGYILASYACGINNGTFFCLRGVDSDQSSLTYKPFYQEGVNRMNKAFPGCNATTSSSSATCYGGVGSYVNSNGNVGVYVDAGVCDVSGAGYSYCIEW